MPTPRGCAQPVRSGCRPRGVRGVGVAPCRGSSPFCLLWGGVGGADPARLELAGALGRPAGTARLRSRRGDGRTEGPPAALQGPLSPRPRGGKGCALPWSVSLQVSTCYLANFVVNLRRDSPHILGIISGCCRTHAEVVIPRLWPSMLSPPVLMPVPTGVGVMRKCPHCTAVFGGDAGLVRWL